MRFAPLLVLALLVSAVAPQAAHADPKSEAQARMEKATELYQEGKYAEALNELTFSYTVTEPNVRPSRSFSSRSNASSTGMSTMTALAIPAGHTTDRAAMRVSLPSVKEMRPPYPSQGTHIGTGAGAGT